MIKALLLTLVLVVLLIAACSKQGGNAIVIKITDNGISADASEVIIKNFSPGARAEMIYRIHNATTKVAMPEVYYNTDADIADYSKADGAIKALASVADWLEIPALSDIPPGQIKDIVVALAMPNDARLTDKKIGFQVGVAGNTDDKVQTAVGIWWLVSMR